MRAPTSSSGHVAVVDGDREAGRDLRDRIDREGWRTSLFASASAALAGLASDRADLVVCDVRLPDLPGPELHARLRATDPVPFVFTAACGDIVQAVDLVRAGAEDYLTKPVDVGALLSRLVAAVDRRASGLRASPLGVSGAMRDVADLLTRVAPRFLPVLLTGETGTGKDVCARFLHQASPRAGEPFVAVNCAAIPSDLLESEVFGHERGAFSGAHQRHLGYAERARGGTLFLDEVAEMPLALQAKLLRLVDDRKFHRVGGQSPVALRARIVCATNRDLDEAVAMGTFREDLLYRVNAMQVRLRPLRERRDDIPWLLARLFEDAAAHGGGHLRGIRQHAEQVAMDHPWPGNGREMRNRVERAVALATGTWLEAGDLFPETPPPPQRERRLLPLSVVRDAAERRHIEQAIRETRGHVLDACRLLGVSRTTLWEKMRRYGLEVAHPGP